MSALSTMTAARPPDDILAFTPPTTLLSPSRLAVLAAGLKPVSIKRASKLGACAMCGYPHEPGDPVVPFIPSDTFTDYPALRAPASHLICGWCAATWNRLFTQDCLCAVMCNEGIFAAATDPEIAYWLLNPPVGPWLFLQKDQRCQHLVWRAQVNHSQEIFFVRLGDTQLVVRQARLTEGVDAARRLTGALAALRTGRGAPSKIPFVKLSSGIDDPGHGALRAELYGLAANSPEVARDIRTIHELTSGEIWGLKSILINGPAAERPARIEPDSTGKKKRKSTD